VRVLAPVLLVSLVPVLGIVAMQHQKRVKEGRLAAVASQIAGRDVEVHCPGLAQKLLDVSSNAGSVYFDSQGRPAGFTEPNGETPRSAGGELERRLDLAALGQRIGHRVR
jgi:hypothetical protein